MKLAALAPALFVLVSMCGSPVPPAPGSVSGLVFYDANYNGIRDNCDDKMSGAPVVVTTADDKTTRVDANTEGIFRFEGVTAGDATVSLDAGPDNWAWPITTQQDIAAGIAVHVESNQETGGIEIGVASRHAFATDSVSVIGLVFNDTNRNGVVDKNECGKRVAANLSGDAQYVSVGSKPFTRVGTNGAFEVRNIAAGASESDLGVRYLLGQFPTTSDLQSDHPCFQQATPKPRYAPNIYKATVPYNAKALSGSLSGTVFDDQNRDGEREPGEPGVPNQVVYLNPQGITCGGDQTGNSGNDMTDEDGAFAMKNVPLGTYTVQVSEGGPSDNPYPATITISDWPPDMRITVRADKPNTLDLPLKVEESSSITVRVFDDANGDGVWNGDEAAVVGYRICASSDSVGVHQFGSPFSYACVGTNMAGEARLQPLISGEYELPYADQFFGLDEHTVPLRAPAPVLTVILNQGEQLTVDLPLSVVTIGEQVIPAGSGTDIGFETCSSHPDWEQPPFESGWASSSWLYVTPSEELAREVYSRGLYNGTSTELVTWSTIAGLEDRFPGMFGCSDARSGPSPDVFVFVNYEPIAVETAGDIIQFTVRRRGSGLYSILLEPDSFEGPFGKWFLYVDEDGAPIDRQRAYSAYVQY